MAEGVLAVDNNLRVIFCNETFARAFGTRMPVEGRILYEVVREPIIREILERAVRRWDAGSGPASVAERRRALV